jgi:UDP-N-acetylglucosamine 2-epimerase
MRSSPAGHRYPRRLWHRSLRYDYGGDKSGQRSAAYQHIFVRLFRGSDDAAAFKKTRSGSHSLNLGTGQSGAITSRTWMRVSYILRLRAVMVRGSGLYEPLDSTHLASLLLAPTTAAMANLDAEGLRPRAVLVGDLMVDTLHAMREQDAESWRDHVPDFLVGPYLLATVHRQATTDDPGRLAAVIAALAACPHPVWLLVHPRLASRAREHGIRLQGGSLRVTDPLPYRSMIAAVAGAVGLITDSGGLQKEALVLGVPCTTLRAETEWPETLRDGWNVLVPEPSELAAAVGRSRPFGVPPSPFGDGRAALRIVTELESRMAMTPTATGRPGVPNAGIMLLG